MTRVKAETATVYKATNGRKRYLTKRAAYRSAAWGLVNKHCYCEPAEPGVGDCGSLCRYHSLRTGPVILDRLVWFLVFLDRIELVADEAAGCEAPNKGEASCQQPGESPGAASISRSVILGYIETLRSSGFAQLPNNARLPILDAIGSLEAAADALRITRGGDE